MTNLLHNLLAYARDTWDAAMGIWVSGGWAMGAIAAVAVIMFAMGLHVLIRLWGIGFRWVPEKRWRKWLDHPDRRKGRIGEMITFVSGAQTMHDIGVRFDELRKTASAGVDRDLRIMKVCVTMGTVMGMLTTFAALSTGSGGDETMSKVAGGISEALVTTETGLVVALPGLFFQNYLARQHDAFKAFIAHLETVCSHRVYRRQQQRAAA